MEEQVCREESNFEVLLRENTELRNRLQFVERECETKAEFITKQTSEQDADREQLEQKVHALEVALEKAKDAHKVKKKVFWSGKYFYDGSRVNYKTRYASITPSLL